MGKKEWNIPRYCFWYGLEFSVANIIGRQVELLFFFAFFSSSASTVSKGFKWLWRWEKFLERNLIDRLTNFLFSFHRFRIDNNDHVIDVNKGNLQFEYDQVHIICPYYEPGTNENETEKYIIYNVSKVEYETCRITNPNPRIIAICDKPFNTTLVTISFRPFTPQPGGLEFKPGNDYYFICKFYFRFVVLKILTQIFSSSHIIKRRSSSAHRWALFVEQYQSDIQSFRRKWLSQDDDRITLAHQQWSWPSAAAHWYMA